MLKKIFYFITLAVLAFFLKIYVKLIFCSSKLKIEVPTITKNLIASNKALVLVFWHGRMLLVPHIICYFYKRYGIAVVSTHRDGEYVKKFLEAYKHKTIRGSSNKGGLIAIKKVIKALNENNIIAITPDGPTGPRFMVNGNVISIAKMTNTPIISISYSTTKAKVFRTWDRFLLPLPFGRLTIKISSPMMVEDLGLDIKSATNALTNFMQEQTNSVDEEVRLNIN